LSSPLDTNYFGREHSGIKHLFLRKYIELAAFATMGGGFRSFNYVDGFAGPWSVSDDDEYSDSSFHQAIQTILSVKKNLEARTGRTCRARFCLCERNSQRADKLKRFAAEQLQIEIYVFEGAFEDRLEDIDRVCADGFTFTFIDPTGFNLGSVKIAKFLARQNGDYLLNFMSEHINRYPSVESVNKAFGRLLADTDWKSNFERLPHYLKNEEKILFLLKNRLKELGAGRFMPDFEIMNPRRNRLQMRLVLGTSHPLGVSYFRDVQSQVSNIQTEVRDQIRNPGQDTLFIMPSLNGVGSDRAIEAAKLSILKQLNFRSPQDFSELIAPVLEDAAIRETHLKDVLCQLQQSGNVSFALVGRQRKPKKGTLIHILR
jgi:three-Cys-motif partner protein